MIKAVAEAFYLLLFFSSIKSKKYAMDSNKLIALAGAAVMSVSCVNKEKPSLDDNPTKPNIIYILADDLGYGDLSCYGQSKFSTPNIDRMAGEGMIFTHHYAGSTVCAPSRSCLMTGLHTGHTPIRGNKEWQPEGQVPMPKEILTIPEILKQAGYVTGAFGKWGLGYPGSEGDPNNQGFDEFYGYNCQRLAHNYYPSHLWYNQKKITLEENQGEDMKIYAPELIHNEALKFIEDNKNRPFFMFYPNVIPHAELLIPEENLKVFRGTYLPEKVYKGAKPGDNRFREGAYGYQEESHAAFAAMVSLLDKQVGDILNKLKQLGLDRNTIVVFTSDNGPHREGGADPDYFDSNGIYRGYKRDLYEGGIREPMIAWWPGKINSGSSTDHVSAFWMYCQHLQNWRKQIVLKTWMEFRFYPHYLEKKCKNNMNLCIGNFMNWADDKLFGKESGNWLDTKSSILPKQLLNCTICQAIPVKLKIWQMNIQTL